MCVYKVWCISEGRSIATTAVKSKFYILNGVNYIGMFDICYHIWYMIAMPDLSVWWRILLEYKQWLPSWSSLKVQILHSILTKIGHIKKLNSKFRPIFEVTSILHQRQDRHFEASHHCSQLSPGGPHPKHQLHVSGLAQTISHLRKSTDFVNLIQWHMSGLH